MVCPWFSMTAGTPYDDLAAGEILQPLGMRMTGWDGSARPASAMPTPRSWNISAAAPDSST
jgi:CubicO group peptidase (beta-lactamase class C family)